MGEQLSLKAAMPLAEILATCRKNVSNTGPWWLWRNSLNTMSWSSTCLTTQVGISLWYIHYSLCKTITWWYISRGHWLLDFRWITIAWYKILAGCHRPSSRRCIHMEWHGTTVWLLWLAWRTAKQLGRQPGLCVLLFRLWVARWSLWPQQSRHMWTQLMTEYIPQSPTFWIRRYQGKDHYRTGEPDFISCYFSQHWTYCDNTAPNTLSDQVQNKKSWKCEK